MAVLRRLIGDALRRERLAQHRTLREVSSDARVSLGYLSEVERGQKEASSELLAAICDALDVPLSRVLREVSGELALAELGARSRRRRSAGRHAARSGRAAVAGRQPRRLSAAAPRASRGVHGAAAGRTCCVPIPRLAWQHPRHAEFLQAHVPLLERVREQEVR